MSGINIQNLFLNSFIYSILKWKKSYFQSLPKFQVSFYQLCEPFNNSLRFFFLKNSKIIHWSLIFPADWKVLLYICFGVPHLNIKRRNVSLSLHNSILGPHTYAQTTNWQKLYIPKLDKEEEAYLEVMSPCFLGSLKITSCLSTFIASDASPNGQKPCKQGMVARTSKDFLNLDPKWVEEYRSVGTRALLASEVKIHSQCVIPPPPPAVLESCLPSVFLICLQTLLYMCIERCGWFGLE